MPGAGYGGAEPPDSLDGSVRHPDQLEALVPSLDQMLLDLADPRDVVLLLELRFHGAPLERDE
jgi:hypothetical protein